MGIGCTGGGGRNAAAVLVQGTFVAVEVLVGRVAGATATGGVVW
jgi:hypothetical protein